MENLCDGFSVQMRKSLIVISGERSTFDGTVGSVSLLFRVERVSGVFSDLGLGIVLVRLIRKSAELPVEYQGA